MTPDFITFTGVDARTDVERLASLSGRYPIEWGVLFSRNRQGLENRYPTLDVVNYLIENKERAGLHLAAHLCGKHAQEVMAGTFDRSLFPLGAFDRIQVNHTDPEPKRLRAFAVSGQPVIAQWRDPVSFPTDFAGVHWLYDPSGGRGLLPDQWPENSGETPAGYAGGINPENVAVINACIRSPAGYWLDMETGVRRDDWFDLDLVEQVCAAIYGV